MHCTINFSTHMVCKNIYNINICRLVRRSLGDEIRRLGVLGSPFCDKIKSITSKSPNSSLSEKLLQLRSDTEEHINKTGQADILEEDVLEHETSISEKKGRSANTLSSITTPNSFVSFIISFAQAISFVSLTRSLGNSHLNIYLHKV